MKSNRCPLVLLPVLLFTANVSVGQQDLPLFPKYQITGVFYAPPGSTSSVNYTTSTQIGSSHSILSDSSTTTTQTQTDTSGFSLFGFGYSNTTTTSDQWVSDYQNSSSESLQTTTGNGIALQGPISSALGIDHDNDQIALWLNPVYKTTLSPPFSSGGTTIYPISWGGFMFNGCDLNATQYPVNFMQLMNGCDPNGFPGPDIVYIPVYCLKNPYFNPPTNPCSQYLAHTSRFWDLDPWSTDPVTKVPSGPGLTIQDYANILQADPLVTQTLVANNTQSGENVYTNPCHPAYGINFDPNEQEIIPDSTKFTHPYKGQWPVNYCGTAGVAMERFNFFSGSIPYPAPQPNGQPDTVTGNLSNSAVNTEGAQATDTHTHSFSESTSTSFAASVSFGSIGGNWNVSNLSAGFNFSTTSGTGSSWTDFQTIGHTATQSETNSTSYSITGPKLSDNWNGPIAYNVYQDTIYGTFAFRDPNRSTSTQLIAAGKTSPIGVAFSGSTNFGTVTVGKHSAAITVTLTNNSPNLMTMQAPALSFSDLAVDPADDTKMVSSFVIVSDGCANKVLKASATCTVAIEFAPTLNAAPNANKASYPVAAYVIAGGDEAVPVADPGATQYDEHVLVTNTVITVKNGTETATTLSGTAVPGPTNCPASSIAYPECNEGATLVAANPGTGQPNGYQFPAYAGTPEIEKFTFTNYNSSSVTFPPYPEDIALTDTTNFSLAPNSTTTVDTCAGKTIGAFGSTTHTCHIWVQFVPVSQPVGTQVTAMGDVNWPTGTTSTIPLAFGAAAAPTQAPIATVNPTSEGLGCAAGPNGGHPVNDCPGSGGVEVMNTGNATLVVSGASVSGPFTATLTPGCSAVAPNASCLVSLSFPGGGTSSYTTTGTLTIESNASNSTPTVALTGQFVYLP